MKHKMKLWREPFESVKSGKKTIEMRLFDEKRSLIQKGDEIEFKNVDTGEILLCGVKGIYRYKNFEELYKNHDKISIGYEENETAEPKDMLVYYSQEEIDRYGVAAIEIQIKE